MRAKRLIPLLLALLLLPTAAPAQEQVFLSAGVSLDVQSEWTVLSATALGTQQALLNGLGADVGAVAADFSANHIAFEVFLPGGGQVSLAAVETEQTLAWGDMAHMLPAQAEALFAQYDQEPYQNLVYTEDPPGCLSYDWTRRAGELDISFACITFVKHGALYTLTAAGALPTEALHRANREVLSAMTLLGVGLTTELLPTSVRDDGSVTPISLVDFTGITAEDMTELRIRTLAGTELVLRTATDTLRGTADDQGLHTYTLSTRREVSYAYTLTATAPGRAPSEMSVVIARQISGDALLAAYRGTARALDSAEYKRLAALPETYAGLSYALRGRASAFDVMNGFPMVLVYTSNPGKGIWREPLWVLMTEAMEIGDGDMLNIYGDIRGDSLPYINDSGEQGEAPVIVCKILTK